MCIISYEIKNNCDGMNRGIWKKSRYMEIIDGLLPTNSGRFTMCWYRSGWYCIGDAVSIVRACGGSSDGWHNMIGMRHGA